MVGLNCRGSNLYSVRNKRRRKESIKSGVKNILIDRIWITVTKIMNTERRRRRVWLRIDRRFHRILGFRKWVDLSQNEIGWAHTKNPFFHFLISWGDMAKQNFFIGWFSWWRGCSLLRVWRAFRAPLNGALNFFYFFLFFSPVKKKN